MFNNAKILVVEDETLISRDIKNTLEKIGYVVPAVAFSGAEAIDKVVKFSPDLVLMDINLKGDIDGIETAIKIYHRFSIPIIYLTAHADDSTLKRAQFAEPIGYIIKPFKARELHATIQMALSRYEMEKKLKEHEQWLSTILRSIGDGVIVTDVKGLVTFLNPLAEVMTGWTQEEALGKELKEVLHISNDEARTSLEKEVFPTVNDEISTLIEDPVAKIILSGMIADLAEQTLLISRNGVEIPIAECAAPIHNNKGCITGVVVAFRDITQRRKAEAKIHKALLKEKELNELKSHFISTASHEFRTPLATILSSADMLERYRHKWIEQKKLEHLHRIQTAAESMAQLLDDVLLVSKAEAGKLQFQPVPLDLAKFCCDLVEEMQLIAETNYTINFTNESKCSNVFLDEKLLRHILTNLLSNAIKYSPIGSTIELNLVCNEVSAIFHIVDKGIGIPIADQAGLFQSFYRASNVGTTPGTGLGLAIVKKSVDLHGGEISVTSEVGVGTTFTVTIPLQN